MGGMTTLEWPLNTPPGYVRNILPLATSARHSAWCISWGEAQRQSIYSDPSYKDGFYEDDEQPKFGLAAARMTALLTYRSRDSFETRFGRKAQGSLGAGGGDGTDRASAGKTSGGGSPAEEAFAQHNDGHRGQKGYFGRGGSTTGAGGGALARAHSPPAVFTAQSYLRYQGDKVSFLSFSFVTFDSVPSSSSSFEARAHTTSLPSLTLFSFLPSFFRLSSVHLPLRRQLLHPPHSKNGHSRPRSTSSSFHHTHLLLSSSHPPNRHHPSLPSPNPLHPPFPRSRHRSSHRRSLHHRRTEGNR